MEAHLAPDLKVPNQSSSLKRSIILKGSQKSLRLSSLSGIPHKMRIPISCQKKSLFRENYKQNLSMRWAQNWNYSRNLTSYNREKYQKNTKRLFRKKKSLQVNRHLSAMKIFGENTKIALLPQPSSGDKTSSRKKVYCRMIMTMNLIWRKIWILWIKEKHNLFSLYLDPHSLLSQPKLSQSNQKSSTTLSHQNH